MNEQLIGQLEQLAGQATVWIGPDAERGVFWGSGFLVAPGWVLTCAHVLVPPGQGAENVGVLRVRGHELDAGARLAYWLGSGTNPEQDLALVRLADGAAHGPATCVRLTDRYDPPYRVTAFGWRTPPGGVPRFWSGRSECNGRDGSYGLTLAPHMEIPHGASGGPLLDRDHGVVVGVVKARRKGQDGGLAVASTALRGFRVARAVNGEDSLGSNPYAALIRAHDRWHHRMTGGSSWVRLQDQLAASGSDPGARSWAPRYGAEASALLTDLPPPDPPAEIQQMIRKVIGFQPVWEDARIPVDWRDGLGWAYDQLEEAKPAALLYLLAVVQTCRRRAPDAVIELERWVQSRIEKLSYFQAGLLRAAHGVPWTPDDAPFADGCGGAVAPDDEERVVAVEFEPNAYGDRFHWRVWSWPDGVGTPQLLAVDTEPEGWLISELPQALGQPLHNALLDLDTEQRRARLELVLPVEHFGLDAHTWPRSAQPPFGTQRQVVLRSLKRRGEPAEVWRKRWAGVTANALRVLPLHPSEYAREALEEAGPGAVPVLCRPPRQSAGPLTDAIGAGYGIALCSLRGDHARACDTDCGNLYGLATQLLDRADSAVALPELLRALRERANAEGGEGKETAWAAHLALLYDDPRRPLPVCDTVLDSP